MTTFNPLWTAIIPRLAHYYCASEQSIPSGTPTIVNFAAKEHDATDCDGESALVTIGDEWRLTAEANGLYLIAAGIQFATMSASAELCLYKNGSLNQVIPSNVGQAMNLIGCTVVGVYLRHGDYVDVRAYHTTGSAVALDPVVLPFPVNFFIAKKGA